MADDGGRVTAGELAELLGYSKQMIGHLAKTGAIERPEPTPCSDGRWRSTWPGPYVDGLLRDPPPRLRARLERTRALASLAAAGGRARSREATRPLPFWEARRSER